MNTRLHARRMLLLLPALLVLLTSAAYFRMGIMTTAQMRAQLGLSTELPGFDFDARCEVISYELLYTARRQDPTPIQGQGARFKGAVLAAIQQAKAGDQYFFHDIRVKCPGDQANRVVNSLAFTIK